MSEDDRRVGPCDKYCAVVDECEARGDVIRELRAENARLCDINRWNIARDGDDIYICESNHLKSDKCEYERWYHRAYVETLRAENARLLELLKPFIANVNEEDWQAIQAAKDGDWFWFLCTAGDLRAARAAMGENDE